MRCKDKTEYTAIKIALIGRNMFLKRLSAGTCYILVLAAFYFLKILLPLIDGVPQYVGDLCFDVLIYAFTIIGTFEILRAVKDKITKAEKALVWAFAIVAIPVCALSEVYLQAYGGGVFATAAVFMMFVMALFIAFIANHEKMTLESLGVSFVSAIYPTVLLCVMVLINHVSIDVSAWNGFAFDSRLAILLVFYMSPWVDSIAYVFGLCFKKYFPKKMAPKLSPNKTVIGCVGSFVGGAVGATSLYFLYNVPAWANGYQSMHIWVPVYMVIGLIVTVAVIFGDLVESCIKRKAGIKDMGNLIPGHGGILDRIDSALFATVAIYVCFQLIRLMV